MKNHQACSFIVKENETSKNKSVFIWNISYSQVIFIIKFNLNNSVDNEYLAERYFSLVFLRSKMINFIKKLNSSIEVYKILTEESLKRTMRIHKEERLLELKTSRESRENSQKRILSRKLRDHLEIFLKISCPKTFTSHLRISWDLTKC